MGVLGIVTSSSVRSKHGSSVTLFSSAHGTPVAGALDLGDEGAAGRGEGRDRNNQEDRCNQEKSESVALHAAIPPPQMKPYSLHRPNLDSSEDTHRHPEDTETIRRSVRSSHSILRFAY